MIKESILLFGGGGHCKSVIEAIESENHFEIAGILDIPDKVGQKVLGYSILGTEDDLPNLITDIPNIIITVGQLKSVSKRLQLYNFIKRVGGVLPFIIASTAYVSKYATIGEGTVILHRAMVNAGAQIGSNVIVNTGAIIEHDVKVGNHTHVSTGAIINGNCEIGNQVFIGSQAVLKQGLKVAEKVIIGAGSVVVQNITEPLTVVGNPAKPIQI